MSQSRVDTLARRAESEGLLDVVYAAVDAPIGVLEVAATPQGVVRVRSRRSRSTRCCRSSPTRSRRA